MYQVQETSQSILRLCRAEVPPIDYTSEKSNIYKFQTFAANFLTAHERVEESIKVLSSIDPEIQVKIKLCCDLVMISLTSFLCLLLLYAVFKRESVKSCQRFFRTYLQCRRRCVGTRFTNCAVSYIIIKSWMSASHVLKYIFRFCSVFYSARMYANASCVKYFQFGFFINILFL